MPTLQDPDLPVIDLALSRAVLYDALAAGFRRPDEATLDRFAMEPSRSLLVKAARFLDDDPLGEALSELPPADSMDDLERDYARLFGHTARGEVPPYETEYGEEEIFQQSQELADIAGFLRAFGVRMRGSEHDRVDHVSSECEFLSLLSVKEAWALSHGDEEMLHHTRKARRLFLRDHLGRFGRAFGHRLDDAARGTFYGQLGRVLEVLLATECRREELPQGPPTLRLRPAGSLEVPAACGSSCATVCGSGDR